jgi:D-serine deaminase-like pyridoxal phosphate-dependent protein
MNQELKTQLETPCVVVDLAKAKENIRRMQQVADSCGCKLRPHIKTHKMPYFTKLQLEAGCAGITCAKLGEAEVMAQVCDDIFIAYPMVGPARLRRLPPLQKRLKRLILAVDSMEMALPLNETARQAGTVFEVRMEVDTGAKRTGIPREKAVALAKEISRLDCLRLTGIYTFKSLVFQEAPTTDNELAAQEEGRLLADVAGAIREAGIPIEEISGGSTPTGIQLAQTGLVTEIRPGTYIFKDYMLCMEKAAALSEISARIYATVVSTPAPDYAVIDGGTKTFPMDILLDAPPYAYPGYAIPVGEDGRPDENLQLRRMNEEHGILTAKNGITGLKVGQVLELIPIHICTAVNMQNQIYLLEEDRLEKKTVEARGMLL